jgi:hypothetical protein
MAVLLVDRRGFKEVGNLIPNRKRMRRRGAASAPAIRMARVLLPRSRKPVSLFISLAGVLLAFALNASPAMALSLNPDAASPGIEDGNTLHWILFVVILVVIVAVNLAILRAARPRTRAVSPKQGRNVSQVKLAVGLSVFALALFVVATIFSDKSREIPAVNAEPGHRIAVALALRLPERLLQLPQACRARWRDGPARPRVHRRRPRLEPP